jgi:hypothetical protein
MVLLPQLVQAKEEVMCTTGSKNTEQATNLQPDGKSQDRNGGTGPYQHPQTHLPQALLHVALQQTLEKGGARGTEVLGQHHLRRQRKQGLVRGIVHLHKQEQAWMYLTGAREGPWKVGQTSGRTLSCRIISVKRLGSLARKGGFPVSISYNRVPKDHQSTLLP